MSSESAICLERTISTKSGDKLLIQSRNLLAKNHFDNPGNFADFILQQINNDKLYNSYLNPTNSVIFDIGANIGLFSLHCVGSATKIYSFEPTPQHFLLLKEFTENHENIIPVNVAISDKDSDVTFYMHETNTTMNSIANKYGNQMTVKGRSLISFITEQNIEKVDFIKCDIEGSEMIALKEECILPLFNIVDKWFIEVHPTSGSDLYNNVNILLTGFRNVGYTCQRLNRDTLYCHKNN